MVEKMELGDWKLTNEETRKKFIATVADGLYVGLNAAGDTVFVHNEKAVGMDIKTWQPNGWVRLDEYDVDGEICGTMFEERWKMANEDEVV